MTGEMEFVSNHTDLSSDNGFQFGFTCNRCGNGYRTEFGTWQMSTATNVLEGAGGLLLCAWPPARNAAPTSSQGRSAANAVRSCSRAPSPAPNAASRPVDLP